MKNKYSFRCFLVTGVMRLAYSAKYMNFNLVGSPLVGDRLKTGTRKRGPYIFTVLVGLLWFGALVLWADTHYVCPYNTGQANPYTTWGTAGTNIIDVVNAAMTNTPSRVVWVSNGVYVLTNQIIITNELTLRSIDGHGPTDTVINGNFTPGTLETNRCLLMSNASVFVSGLTFSNSACMASAANIGGGGVIMYSGILSNCTVRNNIAFVPNYYIAYAGGGGVWIQTGTAITCRVTDNIVTNLGTSGYGGGGGIRTPNNSGIGIFDCLISNNIVYGGNLYTPGGGVNLNKGSIRSSMICNNRSVYSSGTEGGYGGGIYIVGGGNMEACTVTVNQADSRGGGCFLQSGSITNCVISCNSANWPAGGLYIRTDEIGEKGLVFNTTIYGNTNSAVHMQGNSILTNQIVNCVITGNVGQGAAISAYYNILLNCVIRGNKGGVTFLNGTIQNCLIAGNTGTVGGLLISSSCRTTSVSCCTIVSNRDTDSSGSGIRFENTSAVISVSSCIIYSNGVSGTDDVYDACTPTNVGAIFYSCLGTNPGFTGAGIIVANPQFADFAGGNYRLSANSPCINTGTNQDWMTNSVDLDNRVRIRYGTVDMGAYERIHEGTIYKLW